MLSPLLARFAATQPALVSHEMREWFESCVLQLNQHPDAPKMAVDVAQADDGFWPSTDDWRAVYRPYVVVEGVLQIPVKGVLLHGFSFAVGGFATGYIYIRRALERGIDDPNVRGIALICDSPGGHVAGNFELVDAIYAARGVKPIQAFAHESAYSAAYSIASAAQKITVSRTGGVGSIGVVAAHLDVSGAMDQAGMKITFIFAGKHKVDGNAYEALPDDVKARIQTRIDEMYAVFVQAVARNRSMDEDKVRGTEALCFSASEAVSNGLADAIGPLEDAVAAFAADLSTTDEDDEMSNQKDAASINAADHEKAMQALRDEHAQTLATATATARAEGATAAKDRCKAIIGHEEAKGREGQAHTLAFDTDMLADQAAAVLKAGPKAAAGNRFDQAMRDAGDPKVGDGGGADALASDDPAVVAKNIVALVTNRNKGAA